jgi:hypothetical protein
MPVSDENFQALGRAMAAGAPACGIEASRIRALAPGVAEVTGTGVSVFWSPDAHEDGPGWLVRESFSVPSEDRPPVTQTVARIPEDETVRAAKCALMLAVERRLDVAFKRMG